jgi:hypothetical protein
MVAEPWAFRHPESCLTILGGVPGGVRYRPVVALEPSSLPTTLRMPERGIHLVDATRLVDEISQGTGSLCRASQASDRRDVSRKPILVMRVSRDPSTCSSWSRKPWWSCWRPGSPNLTRPSEAGHPRARALPVTLLRS